MSDCLLSVEDEVSADSLARLSTREWLAKYGLSKLLPLFAKECITVDNCIWLYSEGQLDDWFKELKLGVMDRMKLKRGIADMAEARAKIAATKTQAKECEKFPEVVSPKPYVPPCVAPPSVRRPPISHVPIGSVQQLPVAVDTFDIIEGRRDSYPFEPEIAAAAHFSSYRALAAPSKYEHSEGVVDKAADHRVHESEERVGGGGVVYRSRDEMVAELAANSRSKKKKKKSCKSLVADRNIESLTASSLSLDSGYKKRATVSASKKTDSVFDSGTKQTFTKAGVNHMKSGPIPFPIQKALGARTDQICEFSLKDGAFVEFTFNRPMHRLTHIDYINGAAEKGVQSVVLYAVSSHWEECRLMLPKRGSKKFDVGNLEIQRSALTKVLRNVKTLRIEFVSNYGADEGQCALVYVAFYGTTEFPTSTAYTSATSVSPIRPRLGLSKTNVFVRGIPAEWREDEVRGFFEAHGEVLSVEVWTEGVGFGAMGKGCVEFAHAKEATACIKELNGTYPEWHSSLSMEFTSWRGLLLLKFADLQWVESKKHRRKKEVHSLKRSVDKTPVVCYSTTNLYVKGFPHSWTEAELRSYFELHGAVSSVYVWKKRGDIFDGEIVGFVDFVRAEDASACIRRLNGTHIRVDMGTGMKPELWHNSLQLKFADLGAGKKKRFEKKRSIPSGIERFEARRSVRTAASKPKWKRKAQRAEQLSDTASKPKPDGNMNPLTRLLGDAASATVAKPKWRKKAQTDDHTLECC